MTSWYFAYGSNMNPARMRQRQVSFTLLMAGTLNQYKLAFNKRKDNGRVAANVMAATGEVTEGVLYQLTSPDTLAATLDHYEGNPIHYKRQILLINTELGRKQAWVYIAQPAFVIEEAKPTREYLNHLLAGQPYLSAGYVQKLRQVECLPDSDHAAR